jgi:hypothetical protein
MSMIFIGEFPCRFRRIPAWRQSRTYMARWKRKCADAVVGDPARQIDLTMVAAPQPPQPEGQSHLGQAQHPRRQCGPAVRARSEAGEDDSVTSGIVAERELAPARADA